jgi:quinol monooxygenase YgiN
MYLTEQQIIKREDLFMEMVELLADELHEEGCEQYELTEDDAYIAELMMSYFVENYRDYTLAEAANVSMTGYDQNQQLIEEFMEMALDESVGGFVAGAVHGIKNFMSKRKANKAASASTAATQAHINTSNKAKEAKKAAKGATGFSGVFKKAKAGQLAKRAEKSSANMDNAYKASQAASDAHKAGLKSRVGLKQKIDTGVSNIKKKIRTGAERVTAAAGRVAGSFA